MGLLGRGRLSIAVSLLAAAAVACGPLLLASAAVNPVEALVGEIGGLVNAAADAQNGGERKMNEY